MTVSAVNNDMQAAVGQTEKTALEQRKDALWQAAQKVEEMFLGVLLSQINKGISKDTLLHGGTGEEMFQKQLNAVYAERTALSSPRESGLGIAKTVYEQMLRRDPQLKAATQQINDAQAKMNALRYGSEFSPTNMQSLLSAEG